MASAVKILPNSLEAEQGILASIMMDQEVPMQVFPVLRPEDFYSLAHKTIYENMISLYASGSPVELITLVNKLESVQKLDAVGGLEYITSLTSFLPSASNFKHYLDIVKNHSKRRKLIKASQDIAQMCFENENSTDDLNFAEQQIFKISESEQISSLEHIEGSLGAVIDKFDFLAKNGGTIRGISTGLEDFDQITGGLQNSDLIILAARPGVGKTSLAMNLINHAAIKEGKTCAVFSLEMPKIQIAQRSICSVGCVSMTKALNGTLNEEDWRKLWKAQKDLSDAKIFIDDNSLNTPTDILSKCRRLKLEHGLDLVMIDYLQLMKSGSGQPNRVLEIGEITRFLKIAAKELNVPIILLSQLSRQVDARPDHRPVMSDLRDSGNIEQDADIVIFLYNPEKYNDVVVESGQEGLVELEIAKHRNGSPGKIKLRWIGDWVTFANKDAKTPLPQVQMAKPENVQAEELASNAELDAIFGDSTTEKHVPDFKDMENLPPFEPAPEFEENATSFDEQTPMEELSPFDEIPPFDEDDMPPPMEELMPFDEDLPFDNEPRE